MKAVVFREYGSPDVLKLEEIQKPVPGNDEVLVAVRAASLNSWDWDLLRGDIMNRLIFGLRKPRLNILGVDISGRVETIGRNVTQFQPGDEVFGDISGCGWGGFAEFVSAREAILAPKSPGMTFDEAAAVPQAGVLALQGLRHKEKIHEGLKLLINGAGGGVGTFAIQMAKSFGAEVTGVDSPEKLDLMRSIGADHVIDYTREDFTRNGLHYDLILDVVGRRSIFEYRRLLNPQGVYVMVGGSAARILQVMTLGPVISKTTTRKMGILMHEPNRKDLLEINELFEAGNVKPVIDKQYPLEEVPEAIQRLGQGDVMGKAVITISGSEH